MNLPIDSIISDPQTQPRVRLSPAAAVEYREELEAGTEFPPVVVFFDGETYWLADGYHRLAAHATAGKETIAAEVHEGTKRDAILYACGANATNGIRRTHADKRQAVERLLNDEKWSKWSNVTIANKCSVSESLVRSVAEELSSFKTKIRTVTRDGTTYEQDTTNIGRTAPLTTDEEIEKYGKPLPPETTKRPTLPDELTDEELDMIRESNRREGVTDERTQLVYSVINALEKLAAVDVTPEHYWSICYEGSKPGIIAALPQSVTWINDLEEIVKP